MARHVEHAPLRCSLNATVGRAPEASRLERAAVPKRVLIIGGGPAGMEAARVAAMRGHWVNLFEKESRLGGTLNVGNVPPGKEKLNWITEYFDYELSRLAVEIHLGQALDAEKVRALKPDVVIIATGSRPALPPIPGVDGPNVLTANDLLARQLRFTGQHIVIIGGGTVGLETADYLAVQGNDVTVLEMLDTLGRGGDPLYLDYLLRKLKEHAVAMMTGVQVEAIQTEAVLVQGKGGEKHLVPADRVVLAAGVKPANELAQDLQDLTLFVIGDAVEPRKIINAIADGYWTARVI
jgi:NADPH-dependent 2,4-dienoyl-CoA reductase/sulfur reductase-like enzyme